MSKTTLMASFSKRIAPRVASSSGNACGGFLPYTKLDTSSLLFFEEDLPAFINDSLVATPFSSAIIGYTDFYKGIFIFASFTIDFSISIY